MTKLRRRLALFFMRLSLRLDAEPVRLLAQKHSVGLATEIVKGYLAREGFAHCDVCAMRFGLRKVGNKYYCGVHARHANGAVHA